MHSYLAYASMKIVTLIFPAMIAIFILRRSNIRQIIVIIDQGAASNRRAIEEPEDVLTFTI